MSNIAPQQTSFTRGNGGTRGAVIDPSVSAPWLTVVAEKVKTMRYGVVQIVVHDSKIVQIERTERTRFEVPPATNGH